MPEEYFPSTVFPQSKAADRGPGTLPPDELPGKLRFFIRKYDVLLVISLISGTSTGSHWSSRRKVHRVVEGLEVLDASASRKKNASDHDKHERSFEN